MREIISNLDFVIEDVKKEIKRKFTTLKVLALEVPPLIKN